MPLCLFCRIKAHNQAGVQTRNPKALMSIIFVAIWGHEVLTCSVLKMHTASFFYEGSQILMIVCRT